MQYFINALNDLKISLKKIVAFYAVNDITYFGGNNIFFKLKEAMQNYLKGVGCFAHTLYTI